MIEHGISLQVLDIVSCFREKLGRTGEADCTPAFLGYKGALLGRSSVEYGQRRELLTSNIEYAYVPKYPQWSKDSGAWRIRQSALYQGYDHAKDQSVFVLMSPHPDSLAEERFTIALEGLKSLACIQKSHSLLAQLLLETYLLGWRDYARGIEREMETLVSPETELRGFMAVDPIEVGIDHGRTARGGRQPSPPAKPRLSEEKTATTRAKSLASRHNGGVTYHSTLNHCSAKSDAGPKSACSGYAESAILGKASGATVRMASQCSLSCGEA